MDSLLYADFAAGAVSGAAAEAALGIVSAAATGKTLGFGPYSWRILTTDGSGALLITEDVIELGRPYHGRREEVCWEHSDIRRYLNGEFYNSFAAADRARIRLTELENPDNPWFGTNGGDDTKDQVFLLSIVEIVRYLGDSGQLQSCNPNSKLFINDQYKAQRVARHQGAGCWWWLRSPGLRGCIAANVFAKGAVHVGGHFVDNRYGGLRPALWLDISQNTVGC